MNRLHASAPLAMLLSFNAMADAAPAGPPVWLEDIGASSVIDAAGAPDGRLALLLATCNPGVCELEVQRYDQDGVPIGARVAVESVDGPSLERGYASVALDSAGNFVVGMPDARQGHVFCYKPNGERVRRSIRGGYAEGTFVQDLVIASDGTFVVGFSQEHVPENLYHTVGVRFRRFNLGTCRAVEAAKALERHTEFIGRRPLSDLRDLRLAVSADGWLATSWTYEDRNGVISTKLKTFTPGGDVAAGPLTVATIAAGTAGDVGIANDGRAMVAYHPAGGTPGKVAVRRYSTVGVASPSEAFDTALLPGDAHANIGVSSIGDIVAGWTSFPDAADSVASVRQFDAAANTLGDPDAVNEGLGHFVMYDLLERAGGGFTAVTTEFFPGDEPPRYFVRRYEP